MSYEIAQSEGIACQMCPWSEGVAWVFGWEGIDWQVSYATPWSEVVGWEMD